jgi:hypothetical protein
MVAIERSPKVDGVRSGGESQSSALPEEDKYRLVYSKSKVYVNPTAYARDNIPGFVSLVKRVRSTFQLSDQTFISWNLGGCKPYILACLDTRKLAARERYDRVGQVREN